MRPLMLLAVLLAVGLPGAPGDDPKPGVKKNGELPVKERKRFGWAGVKEYEGVVTEIDKDAVMIDGRADAGWGAKGKFKFYAPDVYKAGEVPESVGYQSRYRWQDVKVGDTIFVAVMRDEESSVLTPYVIEICIRRRPGDKLPEGQKPKEDKWRWQKDSLLNDIDNGKDVDDAEIEKLFPPHRNSATGRIDVPGGIPAESREKMTALREKLAAEKAKKDKDLKATPPDKK